METDDNGFDEDTIIGSDDVENGEDVDAEVINEGVGIVPASEILPEKIPILPVGNRPLFPGLTMPIQVMGVQLEQTIEAAVKSEHKVLGVLLAREYSEEDPLKSELHAMGTVVRILKYNIGEGFAHLLVQTVRRFKKVKELSLEPVIRWEVEYYNDPEGKPNEELKAYTMAIISSVKELLKLNPLFQEQLKMLLTNITIEKPGLLMDLISAMTSVDKEALQEILETLPLLERAEKLIKILQNEIQLFQLQEKIKKSIEEKISKQQKEFFLMEQLKAIKKELGLEKDDKAAEIEKFKERLEKLQLSEEAKKVIEEEMNKLQLLEPGAAEYNVSRTYLDWLTILPWGVYSEDSYDIPQAREILERDHYGLQDVKARILEYVSTGKKTGKITGTILCFVGPPGVGKTSIGRSVAESINRKFFRFSLGGMRDEAEIKGHRRTYIGAMPGKFIQSLKTVGTANPVIMLDEIDKIGASFQGDPASALLEVLDPEQNRDFLDHYLDIRFDLSRVMFIATANQLDTIPPALMDRMEVLKLSGYIMEEKIQIARRYLIPRSLEAHGLKAADVEIEDDGLKFIIDRYAREAGVRNLENKIRKIMRKITLNHAEGKKDSVKITEQSVIEYLGQPDFSDELLYNQEIPGVVTGLAWTSMGGATLYIESTRMPGKSGGFKQTGQLGDVMQESSEIAYSFIRSRVEQYGIAGEFFHENFLHLHVPAGATKKDGPSAGITMALSLYSLATDRAVRTDLAMTGEITLTGRVLPVGGIKEKLIAAKRVGIHEIILPQENEKDFKELPDHIRAGMTIHFAGVFDDVLKYAYKD